MKRLLFVIALTSSCLVLAARSRADEFTLHNFKRVALTDEYYAEGINAGDLNKDGAADVVHGPYWFAGPDFAAKHEIYPPVGQNRDWYADNFFSWVYDFNADGWNDIFVVGFPGTPAYVYENPGATGATTHWDKHQVTHFVANEAPHFTNLVGDERPELMCSQDGFFGYAAVDWSQPFGTWKFHAISDAVAPANFGHGLGVGDIDGDGRLDLLTKDGWYQQPEAAGTQPRWNFHPVPFADFGGAEMYAYDVDGDGDNDVITSLHAHEFGLAWHEQTQAGGQRTFQRHLIMGRTPEENRYGVVFSELHSLVLADIDGDGLKDIVTGKTYWSHHRQSPMWDAGAVVYWFKLVRGADGVDWVPYLADADAGIGRQVIVADVNNDQLPDIAVGGMKGAHVLLHSRDVVDEQRWRDAQPRAARPLADGLSPQDAARNMTVPPGFKVTLAAGEPDVHQPVAFTIDPRGRLWVAEAHTYPLRAPEGKGQDKIVILEDGDGDGAFESRKVFIEGLNLVSGLELGNGGVWVGAAPYLMHIPDIDHDDVPDAPNERLLALKKEQRLLYPRDVPPSAEVHLDGWGWQDTHETLNSFIWGPDGWLYGCHGVFTYSQVGPPRVAGAVDAGPKREHINAGVWRYHPTRRKYEVFAWGTSNPWGVDFNEHGHAFATACVIPHLYHIIQGARYQRQAGTHFDKYVFADIQTIADHAHYAGDIRDHAWWGHEPPPATDTLDAGGGHAHAGALLYLGDSFPPEYRGRLYMNNVHGNRVNEDRLERVGSGYVGHHGQDLLLANDRWYRGISLKTGPDGAVYVIDWYDKNACHRVNPEIWDRTSGRIYKVQYVGTGGAKAAAAPPVPLAGGALWPRLDPLAIKSRQLAFLATSRNEWHARTARRLLADRAAVDNVAFADLRPLWRALVEGSDVPQMLKALWALHTIAGVAPDAIYRPDYWRALLDLSKHADENVRGWAIQLRLEQGDLDSAWRERLLDLARSDPSPLVRLYLASGLARISPAERYPIAKELILHAEDSQDHNLPLIYWYGIEPLVNDQHDWLALAAQSRIPLLTRFVVRRAAGEDSRDLLDRVIHTLVEPPAAFAATISKTADDAQAAWRQLVLEELLEAFSGRVGIQPPSSWQAAYDVLTKSGPAPVREKADEVAVVFGDERVLPRLRELLVNDAAPVARRLTAIEMIVRGRDAQATGALLAVLAHPELRGPALRALAGYDDVRTPDAIVSRYGEFTDGEKRDAISGLCSRPSYALALLSAIENGAIPRTDLHAYNVQELLRFKDEALHERIRAVWGDFRATAKDRQEEITRRKAGLSPAKLASADLGSGRRVFAKTCANCHTLFGAGDKVGPDITGSNRANIDYLLENLVDPSAIVGKDYRMSVLTLADGRVVSGLVMKETDSGLTVRTLNDTIVVAKADVDDRQLSDLSMMPEKLLEPLQPDEFRDLVAYLASPLQVPLVGPRPPIDEESGAVPGAIEGERLMVQSKSAGGTGNQGMAGFTKDRWSGNEQLWWTGAAPGDRLALELPVEESGEYSLEVVMTMAQDYGIVQLLLDDEKLGEPIDLYNRPEVLSSGVFDFPGRSLAAGTHTLGVEIVDCHPEAVRAYMFGLDYVRLVPQDTQTTEAAATK